MDNSKRFRRQLSGRTAKRNGEQFENIFAYHCHSQGILPEKHPSGCRWVKYGNTVKAVPQQTGYDWTLVCKGISVYCDTKCLEKGQTFSYSQVKPHQLHALVAKQENGCQSGYVVHFKELNHVVFFDATKLKEVESGKSLHARDGLYLGTMEEMALGNLFI